MAVAQTAMAINPDGRYAMVTGQSASWDPTFNGMQAETSMSISPIAGTNNAVAMITYDDDSNNGSNLVFTQTGRTVSQGTSLLGWSYVVYDQTQSFSNIGPWTYGGKVAPPAGWSIFWGDPSSVAVPGTPYVLISTLAGPASKYQNNGGPATGSVVSYMGGACIALSSDNGRTFGIHQCINDTAVDANGDFYDGSTMAATADGKVFVAYNDTQTGLIDVWEAPSATGTFKPIATPFPGLTAGGHPRLRAYNNVLLVAEAIARSGTADLYMNYYSPASGQWATPTLVASTVSVVQELGVVASFMGASNQSWRRGGMYSFDAGRPSRNGNDAIRVAVTVPPDPVRGLQVQTYGCVTSGGHFNCIRTPEWDPPGSGVFSPVVRATANSGSSGNPTWALVYQQVYGSDLVQSLGYFLNVEGNGVRDTVQAGTPPDDLNGTGEKPWWPQGPCPTMGSGYEGDYDDLQVASESWIASDGVMHPYLFATETNTRIPADLSSTGQEIRCGTQQSYASSPQHVAVNMFPLP